LKWHSDTGLELAVLAVAQVPDVQVRLREIVLEQPEPGPERGVPELARDEIEDLDLEDIAGLRAAHSHRAGQRMAPGGLASLPVLAIQPRRLSPRHHVCDGRIKGVVAVARVLTLEHDGVAGVDLQSWLDTVVPDVVANAGVEMMDLAGDGHA